MLENAIAKIREQSEAANNYNVKYCAAELMAILRHYPDKAELVLQDLDNVDMSIDKCEKKIAAYFRGHRGNAAMSGPIKVISDFYGLDIDPEETAELMYGGGRNEASNASEQTPTPNRINIDDFI